MEKVLSKISSVCREKYKALRFLVLFGSRTRKEEYENSDWDFGYIANQKSDFDEAALYTDLVLL